jgi:spore coat polysaccharide biosynthesis protein SpsF (cytidylyltransferase family)
MLERIVERVRPARNVDRLVVATTTKPEDDAVAELAAARDVAVFRGAENDVLDRFHRAAQRFAAATIVRLTADNPFVDAELVDWAVAAYEESGADYVDTWESDTIAHGLAVEVLSFAALEAAWREDRDPESREHVTPYVYEHQDRFRVRHLRHDGWGAGLDLTVDTPSDLERARSLYRTLGERFSIAEAIEAAAASRRLGAPGS